LLASFQRLLEVDPGFTSHGVLTASASASEPAYDNDGRRSLMRRSLQAIRAIPGVTAAGATTSIPFGNNRSDSVILAEGHEMQPGESLVSPRQIMATPGYFEAMGISILKGRAFDDRDDQNAPPAVIVDERLARHFWPEQDPIGRRLWQPQNPNDLFQVDEDTRWLTIVGVVRSVHLDDFAGTGSPFGAYYFPHAQSPWSSFTYAIKTDGDPEAISRAVRQEMARVDPGLALFEVRSMDQRAELSLSSERTAMTLAGGFGAVALFLSAIGIYGLLAYSVTQRRREIGIRMALGGTAGNVLSLVLKEGLALAATGLALGVAGAIALRGIIAQEIYGISALDPLVIGAAALVLAAVVLAASAIPARRASRIHPVRALNQA
jgi:predicted permease